ncbi:bifunctional serine/threonine-protein kinase/ABC transporter substrate-binding protein [Streptomyces sp. NPDC093094]|uniref:bifunctional serine/threonine-protein kinase/ABC transporter substrate-binding protein n=1 Tax=Streptomyces sp. NPDC093094 TaxID=3366026 RepID=UPI0037F53CDB
MHALRADDPDVIGGHLLLARLGAGGMGVVYLARTGTGELVALKVIRAEHAADPAFRARFRREAALAGRLTGRWTVPVRAADADAREPWLTTDFVAGPSLAEALAVHGPLPAASVLTLGARLAEALTEVHATGLVHRDVKPGNLLLTRDGPRLIDFGIARDSGATALTSADTIVGTPGYLSPEQARQYGGEVGPPSDVFSLGCVLAYAAGGRPPFGGGDALAVLYRTLHEEPDLDGLRRLPKPAGDMIARCLTRDAAGRPTATEVAAALSAARDAPDPRRSRTWGRPAASETAPATKETGAAAGAAADALADTADHPAGPHAGPGGSQGPHGPQRSDWLPPGVLRLVVDRSARALDPPPRAARTTPPQNPGLSTAQDAGPGTRPMASRRRLLLASGAGAAALAVSGTAAGVFLSRRSSAGEDTRPLHTLGLHADLTGRGKATGEATRRGALLAVETHNARSDVPFRLALRTADDRGEAGRAGAAARGLLSGASSATAVLGPMSEATLTAAEPLYTAAGAAMVLVSCDPGGLSPLVKPTLYVTRATRAMQTMPVLSYLTAVRSVSRTAVVQDRAGGAVAEGLTTDLMEAPPSEGTTTVHPVAAGADEDEVTAAVAAALATRPGGVVYAGASPRRAAQVARRLAEARFTGAKVTVEQVMDPVFLDEAGEGAEGWVLGSSRTTTTAAVSGPAARFAAAHRGRWGAQPAPWAAEAYDAVGLIAQALGGLTGEGPVARGVLASALFRQRYEGVAKTISFDPRTRLLDADDTSFLYEVRGGAFRFLGRYGQVRGG